jgi:preprotein translocase subunit SecA
MPDRSWSRGLHQMIEIKEDCKVTAHREPLARISYQRFFRRYLHLAGMSGTALEVADELVHVYNLAVVKIATHRPSQRVHWRERVYSTQQDKWAAVTTRVAALHAQGRPVLIGTRTVEASEQLSAYLARAGLPHQVLNARKHDEEALIIADAGTSGRVTIATNMAGRGTDIKLDEEAIDRQGLHVILTERHAARRIDRQLFGRCARQGDPGSVESILSLEDDLAASFGGLLIRLLRARPGVLRSSVGQRLACFAMARAQRRVENNHFRIRKKLLKADREMGDVLAFTGHLE